MKTIITDKPAKPTAYNLTAPGYRIATVKQVQRISRLGRSLDARIATEAEINAYMADPNGGMFIRPVRERGTK